MKIRLLILCGFVVALALIKHNWPVSPKELQVPIGYKLLNGNRGLSYTTITNKTVVVNCNHDVQFTGVYFVALDKVHRPAVWVGDYSRIRWDACVIENFSTGIVFTDITMTKPPHGKERTK